MKMSVIFGTCYYVSLFFVTYTYANGKEKTKIMIQYNNMIEENKF